MTCPFELAVCGAVGYRRPVPRRLASMCALLALLAAPTVTSTRFFCRYTGQEIVGCAEGARARGVEVRADDCCDQRTFRAVEAVRQSEHDPVPVPAKAAIGIVSPATAPAWIHPDEFARHPAVDAAGPPAFLAHRALLI
jgi:hypothetical protein